MKETIFLCVLSFIVNASKGQIPIDANATSETQHLYKALKSELNNGIMFGHQDDEAYGVNWKYQEGRSDVKDVTGDYPSVYGYELGRLETDQQINIDSVPFDKMSAYIIDEYKRGGVITLSWHLNNPLTGKTAWDPAPGTVASILPGGDKEGLYKSWLKKVATFSKTLRGEKGELIPVIFRPLHELNGNWFWWGKAHCTPEEFKQLWRSTISYLRDTLDVHNFLYAFNTDKFSSTGEYLERYPGDEWVDVIGFDVYQRDASEKGNQQFIQQVDTMLSMLTGIALQKNKISAITEFGFNSVPNSTWWTNVFWKAVSRHKFSYAMAWRNAGKKPDGVEFYVPYKGHLSENDFNRFYKYPATLFQKDVTSKKLYN